MVHILLILAVMALLVRDVSPVPPLLGWLGAGWAIGVPLGAQGLVAAATAAAVRWQARALERRGWSRAARRAEAIVAASRVVSVLLHAAAVLLVGWLDALRRVTGDLVLVDELAALAPVVGVFLAGWWSVYPIDRRLREAVMLRQLDEGRAVYPLMSRAAFVGAAARHQLALVLFPIVCIMGWSEAVDRGVLWLLRRHGRGIGLTREGAGALAAAGQLIGVAATFLLLPVAMRRIWDTVRLGPGPIRDRMAAMCRAHGVRFREMLVWRTHGSMINGAVMGIVGPARYILLTDALLDSLPPAEVEAVTAHEIGHVRRHHMFWLAVAAGAGMIGAGVAARLALLWALGEHADGPWGEAGMAAAAVAGVVVVFGHVSRRFEWQADAFAAQHLSGFRPGRGAAPVPITPEAVGAMARALDSVARLTHSPVDRFSWRHGSIASRQRRLRGLVGLRADRLPIDAQVRAVKIAAAATLAVSVLLAAAEPWVG